jgi:hypothetical protein
MVPSLAITITLSIRFVPVCAEFLAVGVRILGRAGKAGVFSRSTQFVATAGHDFGHWTPADKGAWVSSIQLALGNCWLAQGKKAEAEKMYRGVLAGGEKDLKAAAQAKLSELSNDKNPE